MGYETEYQSGNGNHSPSGYESAENAVGHYSRKSNYSSKSSIGCGSGCSPCTGCRVQ